MSINWYWYLFPYFYNRDVCLDPVLLFVTAHSMCKEFYEHDVNDSFQKGKSVLRNVKATRSKRRLKQIY